MSKVSIVYWSGTGNTAMMAGSIADGVAAAGGEAELITVDEASVDALKDASVIALGCPSMGAEQLEETQMEPFMCELDGVIAGKQIALFGSYGWGNQEVTLSGIVTLVRDVQSTKAYRPMLVTPSAITADFTRLLLPYHGAPGRS